MFAEKLEADPREPLLFFTIPFVGRFGVLGIVFQFWFQLLVLAALLGVAYLVAALLAYKFVLGQKTSASAMLVGFGVICPLLVGLPLFMIDHFDVRNPAIKLFLVSGPALHLFRCFETMYDTLPSFATQNFGNFLWYFCATVEFNVDAATQQVQRVKPQEIRNKSMVLLAVWLQCVALYTILAPCDYSVFPRRDIKSVSDLVFWGNLCNNYLMGALTKTIIEIGTTVIGLLVSLWTGFSTTSINVRPLTATSSPSDFWGKRWNALIASGLKRGIYKPCRKQGLSRPMAALATFAASGLLHEYFLAATAFGGRSSFMTDQSYEVHLIGRHLLFFLWNAVVLILDGLLRGTTMIRVMEESLPKPVRTVLVFMTVLPITHFFTDQFVSLGLYSAFGLGYPWIVAVKRSHPTI